VQNFSLPARLLFFLGHTFWVLFGLFVGGYGGLVVAAFIIFGTVGSQHHNAAYIGLLGTLIGAATLGGLAFWVGQKVKQWFIENTG
jgi:uncharacterized membrane protein YccC